MRCKTLNNVHPETPPNSPLWKRGTLRTGCRHEAFPDENQIDYLGRLALPGLRVSDSSLATSIRILTSTTDELHDAGLPGSQSPISRSSARQGSTPARRNRVLERHGPQRGALGTGEEEGGRVNSPSFLISPGFNKRPASLPKRGTRVQARVGTRSGLRKIKY